MFKNKYFSAQEALAECVPNAIKFAFTQIKNAVSEGKTCCYVNNGNAIIPIDVVSELIRCGFDIRFSYHENGDTWFFKADWSDRACGKIYREQTFEETREFTYMELVSLLKKGRNIAYIVENVSEEEKKDLFMQNIDWKDNGDGNISVERFDDYIEILILLGRFKYDHE
jgi:hypothetical protein